MNDKLIRQLQEEELFPNATPEDVADRKEEVKRLKAEKQKAARLEVDRLCTEDDVPLNVIKELHEDNLAPNHQINFSLEQWKEILIDLETEEPGSLNRLFDLQQNITGALMSLDSHTSNEAISQARRNPKSKWYKTI